MTAEILIVNKSAIALAADSAVTVGNIKTYEGVNKLFMLCNNPPMGIMIYGNAEFLDIPMETLIKEYREIIKENEYSNVETIISEFLKYLFKIGKSVCNPVKNFEEEIGFFKHSIEKEFQEVSDENIIKMAEEQQKPEDPCDIANTNDFKKFDKNFNEIVNIKFKNEEKELKNKIKKFLKNVFISSLYDESTGIVVAGFDKEHIFPSIAVYRLINILDDELKYFEVKKKINTKEVSIMPFAQRDVMDTFLGGVDLQITAGLKGFLKKTIEEYPNKLKKSIDNNKKINGKDLINAKKEIDLVSKGNKQIMKDFDDIIKKYVNKASAPIIFSVGALPKEELGNICESLIHITSLKRKMSDGLETVGGDIDVAIISKGDGFVWSKRKHYFDPNLNYQFFEKR